MLFKYNVFKLVDEKAITSPKAQHIQYSLHSFIIRYNSHKCNIGRKQLKKQIT